MQTVAQKYRQATLAELTPHPRNPRQGDVGAIHTSIEANGFYGAVIVQKSTGHILAGNHRVIAAKHAGATKVPIIEVDCDDETALRILLADNRTNDLATYSDEDLADLLTELAKRDDLAGSGYDADDLDALLRSLEAPDLDTLADEVGNPQPGDLDPQITVRVPPQVFAAWRAHVDTHMGDEPAAFEALLNAL